MSKYTFDTFIKAHLGKAQDYDGVAGCQCVDLIKFYLNEVFDISPGAWGDAHAYYDNFNNISALKNNFTRIANTPSFVPQKGDIMVWSSKLSSGGWGHIAICDGIGDTNYFYSYDNNWTGNHDATTRIKHNYNYVLGVLRPKNQAPITTTTGSTVNTVAKNVTPSTSGVKARGIDVSTYQGNVDYSKVKAAGINYVIIRAGYGKYTNQKDDQFENNYKNAKAAGLGIGVYWYSYATDATSAAAEAKAFLEVVKGKQFDYPAFYDVEDTKTQGKLSEDTMAAICNTFYNELTKAGYFCGIYSFASWLGKHIPASALSGKEVWVAHFDVEKPSYSGSYGMWQYTSTGKVNGVSGNVDCDYCYKDYPTIIKAGGKNGYTKSSTNTTTTTTTTSTTKPTATTTTPKITYSTYYVNDKTGLNYRATPNGTIKGTYKYGTALLIVDGSGTKVNNGTWVKTKDGYWVYYSLLSKTKPVTVSYKTYYVNDPTGLNYRTSPNSTKKGEYAYGNAVTIVVGSNTKQGNYTWVKTKDGYWVVLNLLSATKPVDPFIVGKNYTLQVDLKVRSGAGTGYTWKNRNQLTADGRNHAYNQTKAVLKKGTVITVQKVVKIDNKNFWVCVPSGWLCAMSNGEYYIK